MEKSYGKKIAAGLIAAALIVACICGIVFAASAPPTIPSGDAGTSVRTADASIASGVDIGSTDEVDPSDPSYQQAVRDKWSMPDATVTAISSEPELKSFLHSGSTGDYGENTIGVLTADITFTVSSQSDLGVSTFRGVLDGNGHKITLSVPQSASIGAINSYAFIDTNNDGIKENLETGSYANGVGINGINAVGLLIGANRGTVANLTIDYSSNMEMPNKNGTSISNADNALVSASSPAYMTAFGIVTAANFGNITNVRLNVNGNFIGRQQASHVNAPSAGGVLYTDRNSRSIENTAIVGTLAGIHVNGTISYTYVDLASRATVGAAADGWEKSGTYTAWRNGVAIAGGMVGFFIGSGGMLQNSYLAGTGNVQAAVYRAEYTGMGKGYNAFSGGITGGKFRINDGCGGEGDMIVSSGGQVGELGAQIQGILVSWKGNKIDNNNSDDAEAWSEGWPITYRNEPGTLIDTANYSTMPSIALTYDYDSLFPSDWESQGYAKTGISNTGDVQDWVEVYSSGEDPEDRVEVSISDGGYRIQAISGDYAATDHYASMTPIEDVTASSVNYAVPSDFTGHFVWSFRNVSVSTGEVSTEIRDYEDWLGGFVYTVSTGGTKAAYEVVFGTVAEYGVTYQIGGRNYTAKVYDGAAAGTPTLTLTAAEENVAVTEGSYSWTATSSGADVDWSETTYPGAYVFAPRSQQGETVYAYFDDTNRVVARASQGSALTFTVLSATIDVKMTQAQSGTWTTRATFTGSLNTSRYSNYGQSVPSGAIYDNYTYLRNNVQTDYLTASGQTFTFDDTETTATGGRTYSSFTVWATKSDGTKVAVGSSTSSFTARIDNAAPILSGVRYYAYTGDDTPTAENISDYYFRIKDGDPAFTDVTEEIEDGGWTAEPLFVVVTATDERRSGVGTVNGVGIRIELQTDTGSSISNLSPQAQINYGSGDGQDVDLGDGNAAAIGYISSSYTLRANLTDTLGNTNNSEDVLGTVNVDTVQLSLDSVTTPDYFVFRDMADSNPLRMVIDATVGGSGAEVQYLLVDKADIDPTSTEIPAGYEDAWVSLGSYVSGSDYTIYASYADGAAVFVRLVSDQGLYEPQVMRLYSEFGMSDDVTVEDNYPYFYVDLVTVTVYVPDTAITIDGETLSDIISAGRESEVFAKQYDASDVFDPSDAVAEANRLDIRINWDAATIEGDMSASDARTAIEGNGYSAVGVYSQFEEVGATTLTWNFEVGNDLGTGYQFEILFGSADYFTREKTVDTQIEYRDYDIGVEGLVPYDPQFAQWYDEALDQVVVTYWGNNDNPLPEMTSYPTGFGDTMYFRYAYVGAENGTFNAGGTYYVAVDGVQIVPEGQDYDPDGWQDIALDGSGSGDLLEYDNYNFHFTTSLRLVIEKYGVNISTELYAVDGEDLIREDVTAQILYDGREHIVRAFYVDVNGDRVEATVEVYLSEDDRNNGTNGDNVIKDVDVYYILVKPADTTNYEILNNDSLVYEVVTTTIDLNNSAQTYPYNNGEPVEYVLYDGDNMVFDVPDGDTVTINYYDDSTGLPIEGIPTQLGTYEVQIIYTAGENSNYNTVYFRSEMTIVKADPEIVGADSMSVVYDNTPKGYSDIDATVVNGEYDLVQNIGAQLQLQYYDTDESDWLPVSGSQGEFINAGTYRFRYYYAGNENYNEAYSEEVTLTIERAEFELSDFEATYRDTDTVIAMDTDSDANGIADVTYEYSNTNHYVTFSTADPLVAQNEPGFTVTYESSGNVFSSTRPSAMNVTIAGTYTLTFTVTSDNYATFTAQLEVIVSQISLASALTVTNGGTEVRLDGSTVNVIADYDGEAHGEGNELQFTFGELLGGASITATYYADDGSTSDFVDAGVYSGRYVFSGGLNYTSVTMPVRIEIYSLRVTDIRFNVDEEADVTSDTDINDIISATFEGVDGIENADLIFTNQDGQIISPDSAGRLPAGTYTVTASGGSNYDIQSSASVTVTVAEAEPGPIDPSDPGGNDPGNGGNGGDTTDAGTIVAVVSIVVAVVAIAGTVAAVIVIRRKKRKNVI